ncbi:uncharacterized protein LOC127081892 [Lathyrus oleraceus]|uniref:uncharacterized protein LOC127081892 n=1 Tax=Pisum sativum TaxID=3888 RepID=UPI0021D11F92|nr:uncharacterized protein LOC127081892 [Pisum sativum]
MAKTAQNNQNGGAGGAPDEFRALGKFQRNNPPTFKGSHHLEGTQEWLKVIEKIFRVMACTEAQKAQFVTHMLLEEAEDWWDNTRQILEVIGTEITWVVFRKEFLEKYFPEDVRGKKEMEFLELKQGNMTVAKYAAKFEALVKFCPHYNRDDAKTSKCLKFENGLRPEIKQGNGVSNLLFFVPFGLARFWCYCVWTTFGQKMQGKYAELVNKSRIYDEDSRARSAYYKSISEKKGKGQFRWKPYVTPADKGKQKASYGRKTSGGGAPASVKCFKGGGLGHCANEWSYQYTMLEAKEDGRYCCPY